MAPLSDLQHAILALLPAQSGQPVTTAKVMEGLGLYDPTAAERVAVGRSLTRLNERGLILRWSTQVARQGRGSLWNLA